MFKEKKTCIMDVPREKISQRKKNFREKYSTVRVFFDSKAMWECNTE